MKELFLFILISVLAVVTAFLGTYVILSIANLYSLSVITQFSFIQIYGLWIILGILMYKPKDSDDKSFEELASEAIKKLFNMSLHFLISWGIAFLTFNIFN